MKNSCFAEIHRRAGGVPRPLVTGELHLEGLDDLARDLVLHGKDVTQIRS
jgi:hypothetical protein